VVNKQWFMIESPRAINFRKIFWKWCAGGLEWKLWTILAFR